MRRYSAMLMFQFRVVVGGVSSKRRYCEHRVTALRARSAQAALRKAERYGRAEQFDYLNDEGNPVYFEFVGVEELLDLDFETEQVVWYTIATHIEPMERRDRFIPPPHELEAIRTGDR